MLKKRPFDFVTVYETKVEQHCRTLSVPECDTVVVTKIESVPDKECVVVQVVICKPFSVRALKLKAISLMSNFSQFYIVTFEFVTMLNTVWILTTIQPCKNVSGEQMPDHLGEQT